jgi:hypothetical protein
VRASRSSGRRSHCIRRTPYLPGNRRAASRTRMIRCTSHVEESDDASTGSVEGRKRCNWRSCFAGCRWSAGGATSLTRFCDRYSRRSFRRDARRHAALLSRLGRRCAAGVSQRLGAHVRVLGVPDGAALRQRAALHRL